jgi:hypothetical protein
MTKAADRDSGARIPQVVQQLVDVAALDTVYADVYLRRARELIGSLLPQAQYTAFKRIEHDIEEAVQQSKAATMLQDWRRVETLAGQVETLRQSAQQNAGLNALGAKIYDRTGVSIDPFSPGFETLPGRASDLAELRDTLVAALKGLAAADAGVAAFYESRRAFFAGFGLLSKRAAAKTSDAASADTGRLQQLAAQAAQQGDMAQLRQFARELLAQQAKASATAAQSAATAEAPVAAIDKATYACPVDLAAAFPADAAQRAAGLGLSVARGEPLAQAGPLLDYVTTRVWQTNLGGAESEREGTMRTAAAVDEVGFPKEVAEPIKVLVGQFLRNPLVNSGGARYLPQFSAEEVLIEAFSEEEEPPASGELLSALGLPRRRGLTRVEIDTALQAHGAAIVEKRLGLDPVDYRLVCLPHDLYMRLGRDRGWGRQQQWTHFDGYQVLKNGTLRALVGGDVRYGGLADLVSIATTDQRDSVVARFAVVRRARHIARWR